MSGYGEELFAGSDGERELSMFLRDMDELDCLAGWEQRYRPPEPTKKCTGAKLNAPKTSAKKSPTWLRRKKELNALRQQVEAMETRVVFLQRQRSRQRRSTESAEEWQKWEAAVSTERQRLQAARGENEDLRGRLRALLGLSSKLGAAVASARTPKTCTGIPPQVGTSGGSFDELEAKLNVRFKDVRAMLDEFQLTPLVDGVHVEMTDSDGSNRSAMEYKWAQTLPFDALMASKAVWHTVEVDNLPQTQFTRVVQRSENSYTVLSRCVLQLGQDELLVGDVRAVLKRFTAPEGCAMLTEASTMWSAYRESEALWSHASRESTHILVRQCPLEINKDGSVRHVGCHINALLRSEAIREHFFGGSSVSVHAIVMSYCLKIISSRRQLLENVI